ncbi:MAG: HAD-IA family hydrolase [Candidatus Electrothrix sp. YB6]
MQYQVIIFDFDGTIADSFNHFCIILNRLSEEFSFRTVLPHEVDAFRRKSSREVIRDLRIPLFRLPRILARARKDFNEVMPEIQVVPGMKEVLFQLKRQNRTIGLLTSNASENVQCFLENNGLDIFDFLYASSGLWGKARRLKKAIAGHRFDIDKVLYVGDETRDIDVARRAGVKIASVAWGYNSLQTLREFSPDYLVTEPHELLSICAEDNYHTGRDRYGRKFRSDPVQIFYILPVMREEENGCRKKFCKSSP